MQLWPTSKVDNWFRLPLFRLLHNIMVIDPFFCILNMNYLSANVLLCLQELMDHCGESSIYGCILK